jgi:hypothetical protein
MQFCQPHWDALRNAIKARGIYGLVAKSGEQAVQDIADQFNGTASPFDPLMNAHWAIAGRVTQAVGLAALGPVCPLCIVEKAGLDQESRHGAAQQWVESCADYQLEQARKLGLVQGVQ